VTAWSTQGKYALPLHTECRGEGSSSVLLLHGYGGSAFSWRYWIPALAERHEVWAVDLKGHGSAPAPDDDRYSPHDHAELVYRFIIQKDLRELTLFGHSMGGGIALLVALRLLDQGRLRRLVLVSGAAFPQRLPPFVSLARKGRLARWFFRLVPKRRLIRWVLRSIVHDPEAISGAQVEGYAEPLRSAPHRLALIKTALGIIPSDLDELTARFPEIDVPTLLLWGRHDRVVPLSVGERLMEALPRANLEILEDCGHLPAEELPEDSLKIVEGFLSGDGADAPSQR
jgi:pimeloyl-ACP methyl ester carboxylesterase